MGRLRTRGKRWPSRVARSLRAACCWLAVVKKLCGLELAQLAALAPGQPTRSTNFVSFRPDATYMYTGCMSMSRWRTAVRLFPWGQAPRARAVTRGHVPLYEDAWTYGMSVALCMDSFLFVGAIGMTPTEEEASRERMWKTAAVATTKAGVHCMCITSQV